MTVDVAIVGAGFAGLSAAHALRAGGASIALLEAQARVGGRVDSVRLEDGLIYERGAQFFSRNMTHLMALLSGHGLTHREVRQDPGAVGMVKGKRQVGTKGFLSHDFWTALAAAPSDAADSLADWAATLPLDAAAMAMLRSGVEELWCRPIEDLSFRSIHQSVTSAARMGDEAEENTLEYACVEGLGTLAVRMAAELGRDLALNAPVTAVDRQEGLFHVTTAQGTMTARHLIFAANPVVLGRIVWAAPQDHWLTGFAARFAPGMMRKIVLRYPTTFSRGSDFGWLGQSDDPSGFAVIDSSDSAGGFDSLTVFAGGSAAVAWAGLRNAVVLDRVMEVLEPMLGPAVRAPMTVMQADWTGHPWVGGGYNSWPRPWSTDDPVPPMLRPHDGLHFAGAEIGPQYQGYVEGALRSGADVARRILQTGPETPRSDHPEPPPPGGGRIPAASATAKG